MHRHHSLAGSPTDAVTLLAKLRHAQRKGRTSQPCTVTLPLPTMLFLTWYCDKPCHYQTLLRPSRRSRRAQDFSEFRGVNPHGRGNTVVYLVAPHMATQLLDYHELILGDSSWDTPRLNVNEPSHRVAVHQVPIAAEVYGSRGCSLEQRYLHGVGGHGH